MKIEKVRNHIEIMTEKGILYRVYESDNGRDLEIQCGTNHMNQIRTHTNKCILEADKEI